MTDTSILPATRPSITLEHAKAMLTQAGLQGEKLVYLAVRGFTDVNRRRIYDDAICLVTQDKIIAMNGNTDPNGFRPGHGTDDSTKGMASLKEGTWKMKKGSHKGKYPAFIQAEDFIVLRDADDHVPASKIIILDGRKTYEDKGDFGIHHHYAWDWTTSSLGCQTVPQEQFEPTRDVAYHLMTQLGMSEIKYHLRRP